MICTTCYCMLRGQTGRQWRGTFDIHFDHHSTIYNLARSAAMSCCICRIIWDELTEKYQGTKLAIVLQKNLRHFSDVDNLLQVNGTQSSPDRPIQFLRAFLAEVQGGRNSGFYRLDFRLVDSDSKRLATFLLEQSKSGSDSEVYTPLSDNTSSEEVLQLARSWLHRCLSPDHPECPNETFDGQNRFYPTRLIELPAYDEHEKAYEFVSGESTKHERQIKSRETTVRLVVTRSPRDRLFQAGGDQGWRSQTSTVPTIESLAGVKSVDLPNSSATRTPATKVENEEKRPLQYVTLSHCWGKAKIKRLLKENEDEFKKGIPLSSLPKTFVQAIHFARRLSPSIRYIWIDSLCIIQDDVDDWNRESVQMYSVYRHSYCNLSATAASDGTFGMHFTRDPHHLWEDEINLNTEGIPRPLDEKVPKRHLGFEPIIRRCKIQDTSFWSRQVEDAPVNRRAWVLQERLLAPRVLHFCKDQIAWECRHVDAAESQPYGVSLFELRGGKAGERTRFKALIPGANDPKTFAVGGTENVHVAHEDWKSIVQRYSTTSLTKPKDKLIALAGIAELTSERMGDEVIYVAGMWGVYLASQLLWHVEPQYEDEMFKYPQRRPDAGDPDGWRAPTFSWAAVDAPQGVKCAETVREDDLQISIQKIHVRPALEGGSKFGMIADDCYIDVKCSLIEIEIEKTLRPANELMPDGSVQKAVLYDWKRPGDDGRPIISDLYLDSPQDDFETIQSNKETFCIPAHKKAGGQWIYLLVQRCKGGTPARYRRIGIAVVPAFWTSNTFLRTAPTAETIVRLV